VGLCAVLFLLVLLDLLFDVSLALHLDECAVIVFASECLLLGRLHLRKFQVYVIASFFVFLSTSKTYSKVNNYAQINKRQGANDTLSHMFEGNTNLTVLTSRDCTRSF
jgi:hypothetical protein